MPCEPLSFQHKHVPRCLIWVTGFLLGIFLLAMSAAVISGFYDNVPVVGSKTVSNSVQHIPTHKEKRYIS